MITFRMMLPQDEPGVRALFRLAHPERPERPTCWYTAIPTLVAVDDDVVIGFTGFSVGFTADSLVYVTGHGVSVAPKYRSQGIGHVLTEKRLEIAHELGAAFMIVACKPDNAAMRAVFECNGAKPVGDVQADGQQYFKIHIGGKPQPWLSQR